MVSADLLGAARAIESQIAEDRRRIHSHPELAYEEEETSSLVRTRLEELGIPFLSGLAKTGVVATIKGDLGDGRCLLLRADMDALPIDERSGVRFASQIPGVMHGCGHDAHTAMLLGAARLLLDRRTGFAGTVKLMFQPAEEGAGGAPRMIEAGVLTDPPSTPPSLCTSVQTSLLGRFPVPPDPACWRRRVHDHHCGPRRSRGGASDDCRCSRGRGSGGACAPDPGRARGRSTTTRCRFRPPTNKRTQNPGFRRLRLVSGNTCRSQIVWRLPATGT